MGIYTDPIVLRMDTVAQVKFVGKNITRNSIVQVESKVDVPLRTPHRSVTFIQSPKADPTALPDQNTSSPPETTTGLRTSQSQQHFQQEASDTASGNPKEKPSAWTDPDAGKSTSTHEAELPSIDDILASKLRESALRTTSAQKGKTREFVKTPKVLEKFKFFESESRPTVQQTLDDLAGDHSSFD